MNKAEEKKRAAYYADELALPPECDVLCPFRGCYNKSENKGAYSVGRGYTSYYSTFKPTCGVRMNHGCGHPRRDINLIKALQWVRNNITDKPKKRRMRALKVLDAVIELKSEKEGGE